MNESWTRRELLTRTGLAASGVAAAAAGLGVAACGTSDASSHGRRVKGVQYFVSRPDLNPPVVTLSHVAPGHPLQYIFLGTAASGPGQGGALIMDTTGELVWFSPDRNGNKFDFAPQTYQGRPVLTWFQGRIVTGGHGEGVEVIADNRYRVTHVLHAHSGLMADFHEIHLTPRGTALFTVYETLPYDLRAVGGPKNGWLLTGVAQEVEIATGRLVWEWRCLDHIPLSESYLAVKDTGRKKTKPYDYFHINTLDDAPDGSGDLTIGARNTWSVFKVSRKTGDVIWKLGGKQSDFKMGPGSQFYWQHDSRFHGPDVLTVFDDGFDAVMPKDEKQSRALILNVDTDAMQVTLRRQFTNPTPVLARAMGNTQMLPHGGVFVGWGTNPYFSEFSADGKLLLEGQLTKGDPAYRSFIGPWKGYPTEPPAIAARRHAGGAIVYASWNGATELHSWTVLSGRSSGSLTQAGSARKRGFETAIPVTSKGPYFSVEAHDAKGRHLATSAVTKLG